MNRFICNLEHGLLLLAAWGACAGTAEAASVAAKNKQGNQHFAQGKYQDAEKAYLDAQLEAPGRPELLYNLGNTLIKQKKLDQAIQSLRQAVSKSDRGLQANEWYNLGNALFESGKYQDAAQAYIQSLHVNPADRDAKHNLELVWKKLQQQKQNSSADNQKNDRQKSEDSKQDPRQNPANAENREKDRPSDGQRETAAKQSQPQPARAEPRDGSISREQALQILDAMKSQELAEQRKLLERQVRRKTSGKDW